MSLCVSVFSRERHNVQMLRASLSETSGQLGRSLTAGTLPKRPVRLRGRHLSGGYATRNDFVDDFVMMRALAAIFATFKFHPRRLNRRRYSLRVS